MGCKSPVQSVIDYPIPFAITNIVSITSVMNMQRKIDIRKMFNEMGSRKCMYEPELFPALRLKIFNPLCVNVFASGKIVILGLKKLNNERQYRSIHNVVCNFLI
jgi:TATA-box binding protein (TBP) (component of TFIID and TFIIIB)